MTKALCLITIPLLFASSCDQRHATVYKPYIVPVTCCISHGVPHATINHELARKSHTTRIDDITHAEDYDSLGRMWKSTYIHHGCKPWRITLYSFDERSNVTEIRCIDENGKLIQICSCGYFIVKLKYDEYNRLIKESAYDDTGQPAIAEGSGCFHRVVYRYQKKRCVAEYFDDTGKMTETKTYHGDTISYYGKQ